MLIEGLPEEDAAVWRQERITRDQWTRQDELMAALIESSGTLLHNVCLLLWRAHFKGKPDLGDPPRIDSPHRPRPEPARKPVTTDPAVIRRFFSNN